MKDGIYEKLLDKPTKEALDLQNADIRKVDASESPKVVSLAYQKIIRGILVQKNDNDLKCA